MFQSSYKGGIRSCPKCKSSDYNNRYFKLKINECGHSLCANCLDTLFVRQSGPCPTCGRNLKKSSYWDQIFDDPLIEKQTFYRKKLQKIFNLKHQDFYSLKEYNDYLESVETYVYNLAFDIDVEETKRKVEQFQNEHEALIIKNKSKLTEDEQWVQHLLDEEKQAKNAHLSVDGQTQVDSRADDLDSKINATAFDPKSIIAELMNSNTDASQIIGRKRYEALKLKEETELKRAALGAKRSAEQAAERGLLLRKKLRHGKANEQIVPLSSASVEEGSPYVYIPCDLHINGPYLPNTSDELAAFGYLKNVKPATGWQLAGGYFEALGCRRALMEAFCELFF